MKKRLISTIAAVTIIGYFLAGCSSSTPAADNSAANDAGTAQTAQTETAEDAAAADTQADAATEDTQDRLDLVLERGKLIVGTEGTYSPVSYHDEDDNLVGFDVEVAAGVAKHMGVEVEYLETSWDSIFAALDAGQIDTVINEVGYTEERAQKYDFTEPYAFSRPCILVKGDNDTINSFEDLEGKTCANEATSLFGEMAEKYKAELDPVGAMALFERARENYEKNLPASDARLGGLYNNMALALTSCGRWWEARELFMKALEVMEKQEHGELEQAITWLNLADCTEAELGPEDAAEWTEQYIERAEELLDQPSLPRNGYYAFVCEKCAPVFGHYGYFAAEAELRKRVREIYERT